MRIAFILPSLKDRGPGIFTLGLVEALKERAGIEMEVFHVRNDPGLVFPVKSTRLSPAQFARLRRFDVIHATMLLPDLLLALLPAGAAAKVSALHNFIPEDMAYTYPGWKGPLITRAWLGALRLIPNLIFSSDYMKSYYRPRIGDGRVIPYGIPEPAPAPIDTGDEAVFRELTARGLTIIGAVCLVIRRKGLDQWVQALPALPDCAVVVVGEGEEKAALLDQAQALGVADRFKVLGFRPRSARYNRHFHIFSMVSRSEGFCLAMLEAMACGRPIICSRLPIYRGLIPEEAVAFFQPDEVPSLVAATRRVVAGMPAFAASASKLFQDQFRIEVMADRHLEFYREIAGRARNA